MAKGSILNELKKLIHCVVDNNGNFRTIPIGMVKKLELPEERIRIIQTFVRLLVSTDFLQPDTRIYITNEYITIDGVYEKIKNGDYTVGREVTFNSVRNRIYRDQMKISNTFGNDIVTDLYASSKKVDKYINIMAEQFAKLADSTLKDGLRLNISKDCINSSVTDDEFNSFIEVIKPYTEIRMKEVEDSIDDRVAGYFNYLLSCPDECLSEDDLDRKIVLVEVLTTGEMHKDKSCDDAVSTDID